VFREDIGQAIGGGFYEKRTSVSIARCDHVVVSCVHRGTAGVRADEGLRPEAAFVGSGGSAGGIGSKSGMSAGSFASQQIQVFIRASGSRT
jgi:hypothetical protein